MGYIVDDDIFLYKVEENENGAVYTVCYSLGDSEYSYKYKPYHQVLNAIKHRCVNEKERLEKGDHFNTFKKWDSLRQAAETIGKIPSKFIVVKD